MGTVYEAIRVEEGFTQRAAIKMIRPELAPGLIDRRFRRERELVARLRHRNIAALVDGGITSGGRLWYAMELVEGESITQWSDRHRLDPLARVRLFRQACAAVHHAHRELIIHRDLKPSNILVTGDGTVKLLDFGIAKLLDPEESPSGDLTAWGGAPATPNYASPEQLAGDPVSVASDVYSLGVVLYQLLAGRVPFVADSDLRGHYRRVAGDPPPPLAARVTSAPWDWSPARARRWLAGDAERIVQMALRKEPDRRYASADQLGADLERLMLGLPVTARPDSRRYRLAKLVARNRIATAVTVILTLGLIGASIAAIDRAGRAEQARAAAAAAATRATRVTEFLAGLLGAPDPWVGDRDVTVRQLLDQAGARAAADFAAEPAVEATVRLALGRSFRGLGRWEPARRELERARSLALIAGLTPERIDAERGLGEVLAELEKFPAADAWYDSAAATARAAGDSLGIAAVLADRASLYGLRGQLDSAASVARIAVDLRRRFRANPIDLANALNNLAVAHLHQARPDSARIAIEEAVALLRAGGQAGEPPLAAGLATLGGLLSELGDLAGAERSYRESLALRRKIFGVGHPDEVGTLVNLGATAIEQGRFGTALAFADTVVSRIGTGGLPQDHALVGAARTVRGRALNGLGRFPEAEAELRAALVLRRAILPPGHPSLAFTLVALGETLDGLGRRREAVPPITEAAKILAESLGPEHPRTRSARQFLSRIQ
jgi:serine/threonine-protein kinase